MIALRPLWVAKAGLIGELQVAVIIPGHDAIRNALPARAGFMKLYPSPPNACLATRMANPEPTAGIQRGEFTGRLKARRSPVNSALPSRIVGLRLNLFLLIICCAKNSVAMADMQEINVSHSTLDPKKYMAPKKVGIKDKHTVYIIRLIEISLRI